MKNKKIIILGTCHPFRGGLAAYNERLALEFQSQGNELTLFTFSLQYPGFLFPGKTQYADWDAPDNLDIKVEVNSLNPFNWLKIGRKIKKLQPDILIFKYWLPFMGPCFGTIARLVKRNKKTQIITIIDNIIPHEKRMGDRMLSSYFVKPVDAFVTMSDAVLKDLDQFDTQKPRALSPHPLFDNFGSIIPRNEALQKLGLDPSCNYMLFFGFIRAYKGLDLLLKAFADSVFRRLNVKLIIAGEFYEDEQKYREIIEKHPLKESIILKNDFIPDQQVNQYFCASDIVVQPYKSATQSGVTQIGYFFEKPMLVTDVGGLKEIIPNGKVGYVTPVDVKKIRAALTDFFTHKRAEEFKPYILKEKQKYTWDKMVETIEQLTKEIHK